MSYPLGQHIRDHELLGVTSGGGPGGTTDHAALSNLDFPNSGHTGDLDIAWFNGGTGATGGTFWRGDGTWAAVTAGASGADGLIQFAALGALSSDPNLYWDGTLNIGGNIYLGPLAFGIRSITIGDSTGADEPGAQFSIYGANAVNGNADGGPVAIVAGNGVGSGQGGGFVLTGGIGARGGTFQLAGGASDSSGSGAGINCYGGGQGVGSPDADDGGDVSIFGGDGANAASATNGGHVILKGGIGYLGGASGGVKIGLAPTDLAAAYGATPVAQSTGWTMSNVSTDKVLNANSTTLDELADVVATLINQLKTYGWLGA